LLASRVGDPKLVPILLILIIKLIIQLFTVFVQGNACIYLHDQNACIGLPLKPCQDDHKFVMLAMQAQTRGKSIYKQ
ncbi:hypothetical protein ACJX0J_025357, partial [Zea mays]